MNDNLIIDFMHIACTINPFATAELAVMLPHGIAFS